MPVSLQEIMSPVCIFISFSGVYSQETSDYGLVNINDNGTVTLRTDYDNLQSQYNKLDVKLLENSAATNSQTTPPQCSPDLISDSGFSTNFAVPAQPPGAADLITNGISNPNNGKIVSVGDLTVKVPIYNSAGKQLSNIKVVARNDANTPNGQNTGGSATSSGTASPSSTKKAGAGTVDVSWTLTGLMAFVLAAWTV